MAGAAGVAALAGCSGDSNSGGDGGDQGTSTGDSGSEEIELEYWTLFAGGDGDVMKSIIDRFNEEQPIGDNISISRQRSPREDHYTKLFTSMTAGQTPDLAIAHATYLPRLSDTAADITEYVSDDDYTASILDMCKIDGNIHALPMDSHPVGLYYNEDILAEAGVEAPFADFSEFEEACNAILENTDAMPFGPDTGSGIGFRQYYTSLKQLDGNLVNEEGTEAVFDEGPGLAAMEYYASVSGERGWDEPDTSDNRIAQGFENGDIAMIVDGTWYVGAMENVDFNWNMTKPWITPNAERHATCTDSHSLIVPDAGDMEDSRIEAAVNAAEWITQENPEWGSEAGHLPAYNPIQTSDALQESDIWDKTLQDFMEMAQDDQLAYWPRLENIDHYNGSNWTWLPQAYNHSLSPEEAVQQGVETWNANL